MGFLLRTPRVAAAPDCHFPPGFRSPGYARFFPGFHSTRTSATRPPHMSVVPLPRAPGWSASPVFKQASPLCLFEYVCRVSTRFSRHVRGIGARVTSHTMHSRCHRPRKRRRKPRKRRSLPRRRAKPRRRRQATCQVLALLLFILVHTLRDNDLRHHTACRRSAFCIHRQTAQSFLGLVRKVPDSRGVSLALATAKKILTVGIRFLTEGKCFEPSADGSKKKTALPRVQ